MKRCPTCQKTYADTMRFCQTDGTPLDEDTIESGGDPYKTTVGGAPPRFGDDDLLELSDDREATDTLISSGNENSRFNQVGDNVNKDQSPFDSPTIPISTPFDLGYQPPSFDDRTPPVKEPETPFGGNQSAYNQSPFEPNQNQFGQQMQQQWSPPPAPNADWQNQNLGANTPFQPPIAGGQDKTLAIVSLVCGILSLTCCGPVTGIAALITGYMAKNNVDANPQQYDGRGMALAGIIMGGISLVLTVLYFVFVVILGILR